MDSDHLRKLFSYSTAAYTILCQTAITYIYLSVSDRFADAVTSVERIKFCQSFCIIYHFFLCKFIAIINIPKYFISHEKWLKFVFLAYWIYFMLFMVNFFVMKQYASGYRDCPWCFIRVYFRFYLNAYLSLSLYSFYEALQLAHYVRALRVCDVCSRRSIGFLIIILGERVETSHSWQTIDHLARTQEDNHLQDASASRVR